MTDEPAVLGRPAHDRANASAIAVTKVKPTSGFKPKRGRPSASQVTAIDGAILSAAREMFLENGYASTSMEAVATSVGVSKGTLYSRYPTKSDLFHAIVAERLGAWTLKTEDRLPMEQEGLSGFMFRSGISFLSALRVPEIAAFDRLIMSEAGRFPELFREFNDQGYAPFIDTLAKGIGEAAREKGWPLQDAQSVAVSFISALHGWYRITSLLQEPTTEDVASYVGRLVAILFGGRAVW